jgi:hypothetical protein
MVSKYGYKFVLTHMEYQIADVSLHLITKNKTPTRRTVTP